ncbi:MAG: SDR family oxidoreductase [Acidobacteria bacterium]|nr:SDR family oxidoreductase [Acidobacteriota bacterium]
MQLAGKNAIVTGAGSGIGEGIALRFAQEGAKVIAVGRTADKLAKLKANAGDVAARIIPHACDVGDLAQVRALFEFANKELGQVDILVNNAGVNVPKRAVKDLSPEDFDYMCRINLSGAFYCISSALPQMRERKDGVIINVSSVAGLRPSELAGAGYNASKHGLSALSLSVHNEEGKNGIRCCMICPGEVNTPILEKRAVVPDAQRRAAMLQPEDLAHAAVMVATLHPRAAVPELVITPANQPF